MPTRKLSVLYPESSTPQWAAIAELLDKSGAEHDKSRLPALELIPVPSGSVVDEARRRAAQKQPPDLAMLPITAVDRCSPLPISSIHRFAPSLTDLGALPVVQDNGETIGLRTLWDLNSFIGVTRIDDTVLNVLKVAGTFKDPRLPANTVERIQFLIHNQTLELPKKLGGMRFDLHFPGILDLKVVRDPANPNRAVLSALNISGQIPLSLLPFLPKLPWPSKPNVQSGEGGFRISLRQQDYPEGNSGTLDYLTGQTQLSLSVRTTAPFLKRLGMEGIDVEIYETGRWDRTAGTFYVDTGTITLASGIFAGLKLALVTSSKNEYREVTSSSRAWEPAQVEILKLNEEPSDETKLLDVVRDLLEQYSAKATRIAYLISLAASVDRARAVFVTYACIQTNVIQGQEKKEGQWVNVGPPRTTREVLNVLRRPLPDRDAILWFAGANPGDAALNGTIIRNTPLRGCE